MAFPHGRSQQTRQAYRIGRKHRPIRTTRNRCCVSLVVRTGSAEMNTQLAARALRRGLQLHAYGVIERTTTGEQIVPQSEREVFELCGVPYREPRER